MASVVVQTGQCGNQIGQAFWDLVLKHKRVSDDSVGNAFIHPQGKLRSVNVDSEQKVIRQMLRQLPDGSFRENNIILGQRGRGTNWALGYHGNNSYNEDHILHHTMEGIRKEVERCDNFSGVIMFHSISGGTGSGVGSHLAELIRDRYSMSYLMNCVVVPHASGESPLQHYNTLLCLAHLQQYSDTVVWFHNDEILTRLQKESQRKANIRPSPSDSTSQSTHRAAEADVSMTKMNEHIAACLCGVMLPIDTLRPMGKMSWENLTGACLRSLNRYSTSGSPYSSLSNLFVARGDSTHSFHTCTKQIEDKVRTTYNCVGWNPFPVDFWSGRKLLEKCQDDQRFVSIKAMQNVTIPYHTDAKHFTGVADSASVTLAANYSSITDVLDEVVNKAEEKYRVGAYLHWYTKYGCEQTDFEEAFQTVKEISSNYVKAVT